MHAPISQHLARPILEIRDERDYATREVRLEGAHLLIGRNPELPISLDEESSSRLHAELVRGPQNRWWIHDLGSTNGTFVNGVRITQRLLHAGDVIRIGSYSMRFCASASGAEQAASPARLHPAHVKFRSFDFTDPASSSLVDVMSWGQELRRIETRDGRQRRLCSYVLGDSFPATAVSVISLSGSNRPQVRLGPLTRPSAKSLLNGLELADLFSCCPSELAEGDAEAPFEILGSLGARPEWARRGESAEGDDAVGGGDQPRLLACKLSRGPHDVELVCVQLPPECRGDFWGVVVRLIADQYRQADELWQRRDDICADAALDHELRVAHQIQGGLVRPRYALEGIEVAVGREPSLWVGGEYADAVRMRDGRVLLLMAEPHGRGLHSAFVASRVHAMVHSLAPTTSNLAELVSHLNDYLIEFIVPQPRVSFLGVALASDGTMECINAGHPEGFVVRTSPETRIDLVADQPELGSTRSFEPAIRRFSVTTGDVLVLFTAGVTATEDLANQPFGRERLVAEAADVVATSPSDCDLETMQRRLQQRISLFRGSLLSADENTFLMARLSP